MRLICIRPLVKDEKFRCRDSVLKGLIEGEFYYLYDGYEIRDDEILRSEDHVPRDLFVTHHMNVR